MPSKRPVRSEMINNARNALNLKSVISNTNMTRQNNTIRMDMNDKLMKLKIEFKDNFFFAQS